MATVTPPARPAEKPLEPARVDKPAEKAPEKAVEQKPADQNAEADIVKAVQGWAAAWSRKDVKAYLAYYAPVFQTPNGQARKAWENERAQRIDKPGKLQVGVEDIKVSLDGDKATVKFRQHYSSASLKSSTGKTLVLIRSGGKWLIQQERVG